MKKFVAITLAVVMLLSFAACGKTPAAKTDTAVSDTKKEVLTMATNAAFPPYEYYEGGKIVGIDAEIAQAIADKLGMTLEIEDMEFGSIIAAVQTGKVLMGMAGLTVTDERLESVAFSNPYATGVQVVITKADSGIKTIDDLEGKIIGVQQDTTGDIYASDEFGAEHVDKYNKGADAILALTTGKVDAVIIDNEPAKAFVAANEGLVILDTEYAVEDYAIALSKENTELLEKINKALAELTEDGTIAKIVEKYIPAK